MSENELKDNSSPLRAPAEEEELKEQWWGKLDRAIKIISPILIPLVIALLGFWGQRTITQLSVQEQNSRLYTELLSRREEAESSLRKDMFKEIMSGFFTEIVAKAKIPEEDEDYKGDDIKDMLSKKILKLEMLALNFGDSLSIGPLFSELSIDIEQVLKTNRDVIAHYKTVAAPYQKRLRSLAKRVASRQMSTISAGSKSSDKYEFKITANTQEIRLEEDEIVNNKDFYWSSMDSVDEDKLKLDGVTRFFEIKLSDADFVNYTINVNMKILEIPKDNDNDKSDTGSPIVVADRSFNMDFFNFPLIDNTRLSHNHRFALIIEHFDYNTIELKGVLFPGSFASQRDKPFLNDAINELKANKNEN